MAGDNKVEKLPSALENPSTGIENHLHLLDSAQGQINQNSDLAAPPGKAASAMLDGFHITDASGSSYDGGTTYDPGNQYDAGTGTYSTTPGYH